MSLFTPALADRFSAKRWLRTRFGGLYFWALLNLLGLVLLRTALLVYTSRQVAFGWGDLVRVFGHDMLRATPHRAFLGTYQKLGLLTDEKLGVLSVGRRFDTYQIAPPNLQRPAEPDKELPRHRQLLPGRQLAAEEPRVLAHFAYRSSVSRLRGRLRPLPTRYTCRVERAGTCHRRLYPTSSTAGR